jgi:putative alpha-1,2-mannosidase
LAISVACSQNVEGLIELLGGKEPFADKLEQLFQVAEGVERRRGHHPTFPGLIGAYAHGNETGSSYFFLFNYAGRSWRTQELTARYRPNVHQFTRWIMW